MLRLNMGSGFNRMDGWINVDCYSACEPDVVCNLDGGCLWPWLDNEVDEVLFNHSLEHMGADVAGFRHVMQELYRVCKPGVLVQINVPHPRHDDFLNDPTHVRVITPELMGLMSKKACAYFREHGAANSPIAEQWDVDFEVEKVEQALDPRYEHWRGDVGIQKLITQNNNVLKEIRITLRVVK
jgi:hypothetical protein